MAEQTVSIPGNIYHALVDRDSESLGLVEWDVKKTRAKATGSTRALAEFGDYLESLADLMDEDNGPDTEKILYAEEMGGYGATRLRRIVQRFPTLEHARAEEDAERAAQEAEAARLETEPDADTVAEWATMVEKNRTLYEFLLVADEAGETIPVTTDQGAPLSPQVKPVTILYMEGLVYPNESSRDTPGRRLLSALGRAVVRELRKRGVRPEGADDSGTEEEVADDGASVVAELADKYNLRYEDWGPLVRHTGDTVEGLPRELQTEMQIDLLAEWGLDMPSCRITALGKNVIHEIRVRRGLERRKAVPVTEPVPDDTDSGTAQQTATPEDGTDGTAEETADGKGTGFADYVDPGSVTVAAIEAAWRDVQARHPEVPDVVVVAGASTGKGVLLGKFRPNQWDTHTGVRHELMISGECLSQGPERVLQTVIHEAVHAVNHVRGIKDTASRGQRHNKRFIAMARELGLEWPKGKPPHHTWGFTAVEITDETLTDYADTLNMLDRGRAAWRTLVLPDTGDAEDGTPARKKSPRTTPKGECGCEGKIIRASRKVLTSGTVLCADCKEPFRMAEE